MSRSLLITQCLQNDFVKPIEKYDPLPNPLHVGYSEALRLLGERVELGPVNRVMQWAYEQKDLGLIHIRDWHDKTDARQKEHMDQFGNHCIKDTPGAEFVFESFRKEGVNEVIINASGLNDFVDTDLEQELEKYRGQNIKIGVMGVWTEAKVYFLCYDLRTRYPDWEIGVCSALTASSSRNMHFVTTRQLESVLGVHIFSSVGDFTSWLNGKIPHSHLAHSRIDSSHIRFDGGHTVSEADMKLLLYLFRDSADVQLKSLDGGYSGNEVLKARSRDHEGHREVPSVIKIGDRTLIARERTAFEQIEEVMGYNAPSIVDFAEFEDRGAIKYRYASMLEGKVTTFQDMFESGIDLEQVHSILHRVFKLQLGRLYDAAHFERLDLLDYYDFDAKYAGGVLKKVETITGRSSRDTFVHVTKSVQVYNPWQFYKRDLIALKGENTALHFKATVHGDLNGKNIIIDAQENVWIIDFFHTHYGHVLRDLIKLENDLLYIFTKLENEQELDQCFLLTDALLDIENIGTFPSEYPDGITFPHLQRTWDTIRILRSFYNDLIGLDKAPFQTWVAMMRYSVHTLSFEECSDLQKKWALYASGRLAQTIKNTLIEEQKLMIDFIYEDTEKAQIGMTILPGRKDWSRDLQEDLDEIVKQGISGVLTLVTKDELQDFGVPDLLEQYKERGLDSLHLPILDQRVPNTDQLEAAMSWMEGHLSQGRKVLIHCVGGIGRSGTVAASYLRLKEGLSPEDAIATVRKYRSERCLENETQERFISEL